MADALGGLCGEGSQKDEKWSAQVYWICKGDGFTEIFGEMKENVAGRGRGGSTMGMALGRRSQDEKLMAVRLNNGV